MHDQTANIDQVQESRKAVVAAFIWIVIPLLLDAALVLYWLGFINV
ncbi:MAG: hypothetical protein HKN43_04310 [Rhodothermales bacterium]|nr:hypothetical protein [Rhodothermales bacterium]